MKRKVFSILLSLLLTTPLACADDRLDEVVSMELSERYGLSDYQYFTIYPYLERAFRAQKENDKKRALNEFKRAHERAPENEELLILLANAHLQFGQVDEAKSLVKNQLKRQEEARLLGAYLQRIEKAYYVAPPLADDLESVHERCQANPTIECLAYVGQEAVNQGDFLLAQKQLENKAFRESEQGLALQRAVMVRAAYLKQWDVVNHSAEWLDANIALTPTDDRLWFNALLNSGQIDRIITAQKQGRFTDTESQKQLFYYFQQHYKLKQAEGYFYNQVPLFSSVAEEKAWLEQVPHFFKDAKGFYKQYQPKFNDNQDYIDEYLAIHRPVPVDLEIQTYRMMNSGQGRQAALLLVNAFPFNSLPSKREILINRLISLVEKYPNTITSAQLKRLQKPLANQRLRILQSKIPRVMDDCEVVEVFFGDMSANYPTDVWNLLAQCYANSKPGLALYAYEVAAKKSPTTYQNKAVAYQAYQVKEYRKALTTWQKVPIEQMTEGDHKAAINSALAAEDWVQLKTWLDLAVTKGLTQDGFYWSTQARLLERTDYEAALRSIERAIGLNPDINNYAIRARLYEKLGQKDKAVADLQHILTLDESNIEYQAELGYLMWSLNRVDESRYWVEKSLTGNRFEINKFKHLSYANQRLDRRQEGQYYAKKVIDYYYDLNDTQDLTDEQRQEHYDFRRLHEDTGRRWSFSMGAAIGLKSESEATAVGIDSPNPSQSYRSFNQFEAEYRLGRNMLIRDDLLSVYSRLFTDTTASSGLLPTKNPMLGAGLRWKPLRDYTVFLAAEQQIALSHRGGSDFMLRASASFLNGGKYSDEWHPNGNGWFAHNLYLDYAYYTHRNISAWTADYRASWHQKVVEGQTLELYGHIQTNGVYDSKRNNVFNKTTTKRHFVGVGVRWNVWTGQSKYNAWPHKLSLGFEVQRKLYHDKPSKGSPFNTFLSIGVHW